ncbi:MAG: carboxypeptidase regulatory-like domain-containing protein, partial [Candidatus Eremiobacteraeota bacterium]|nr:carboxypeptidase regulatory-like domain-containing protein [Candidatus Eremiobacteraeota bacterium]
MKRGLQIGCTLPLILCAFFLAPTAGLAAGTTGTISGTVRDTSTSAPIANVAITAVSPSQKQTAVTDAAGFYSLKNLAPDTYVVSFQKDGYEPRSVSGVTVFQDQTVTVDQTMTKSTLKEIGRVTARSSANLVQPGQTADVYNLTSTQFNAAQGGDSVHKTLFNYLQTVPGITGSGMYAQPRVRGGLATDVSYEFDGIPINDRLTGFFTTNLANIGVGSVEVYTGGYNARYGNAAQGVFNSVVKRGTYPAFGLISTAANMPTYGHFISAEYGWATPDNKYSAYLAFDGSNTANDFYWGQRYYPLINLLGIVNGPGPVKTTDI